MPMAEDIVAARTDTRPVRSYVFVAAANRDSLTRSALGHNAYRI